LLLQSLARVPFAVLGNKTDLKSAVDAATLSAALSISPGDARVHLFMTSLVAGNDFAQAFEWIARQIHAEE
jgi:hypothetical protein